jgi:hypothetical protein
VRRGWTALQVIGYGTLIVGILDGLDAIIFFGWRGGATPATIGRTIAAGLVGRTAARAGGIPMSILGWGLHFVVACGIVTVYYVASRYLRFLVRYPLICGPLYGIIAFFVMNLVVIPLSAIGAGGLPTGPALINGLLIHAFGVGLPTALVAARASSG